MDLTKTIVPKSDQQNYEDYLTGPQVVTISEVRKGTTEQPVEIHLEEFPGRPYKPSKSMRRVIVSAWGPKSSDYVGRQLKLYGDPEVKYGGQKVGGIKIAAMSHLEKPVTLSLTVTRGKRAPITVDVLKIQNNQQPATDAPLDLVPLWDALKNAGFTTPNQMLTTVKTIIGRDIVASEDLTADDVQQVLAELSTLEAGTDARE